MLEEKRVPASVRFMPGIEDGCTVRAGDQITKGFVNFRNLRKLTDIESTMHTFVENVKDVYTSQGVDLNDKHIEVIARQMLRRVQITNPGDSSYLLGQYVDRYEFADEVERVARRGGTPPTSEAAILGTLKVAASIDSWLSSASFIRTAGVLTEAAIEGKVDHLLDLKSNVIVGKKIPVGTGLKPYSEASLTYRTSDGYATVGGATAPGSKALPEWAPPSSRSWTSSFRSSSTGLVMTIIRATVPSRAMAAPSPPRTPACTCSTTLACPALDQQVQRGRHRDRWRPGRQVRGGSAPHRWHRRQGDRGAARRPGGPQPASHP